MFKIVHSFAICGLAFAAVLFVPGHASAQQFGGLLGVYAQETGRGLLITGFIPGSSADELNRAGEMKVGDVMLRLDGRPLRRGADVFRVTDLLEAGADFVELEMVTRTGFPYRLAITPTAGPGVGGAQPYSFSSPVNGTTNGAQQRTTVKAGIVVKESRNRETDVAPPTTNRGQVTRDQNFIPNRRPRD